VNKLQLQVMRKFLSGFSELIGRDEMIFKTELGELFRRKRKKAFRRRMYLAKYKRRGMRQK